MINSKKIDSCTEMFKTMEILDFYSEYILSLLSYVMNNEHLFTKNLEVHISDIRSDNIIHLNLPNLTKYQKAACYAGNKIFNRLPTHMKCVANGMEIIKLAFEWFLLFNSFCSLRNILLLLNNIYFMLLCLNVIINIFI